MTTKLFVPKQLQKFLDEIIYGRIEGEKVREIDGATLESIGAFLQVSDAKYSEDAMRKHWLTMRVLLTSYKDGCRSCFKDDPEDKESISGYRRICRIIHKYDKLIIDRPFLDTYVTCINHYAAEAIRDTLVDWNEDLDFGTEPSLLRDIADKIEVANALDGDGYINKMECLRVLCDVADVAWHVMCDYDAEAAEDEAAGQPGGCESALDIWIKYCHIYYTLLDVIEDILSKGNIE